jgi:deferrochelatase/peroxidase EfeB
MTSVPQTLMTIVAPLALARLADAEAEIDRLGNPARELGGALDVLDTDGVGGTHFASLHAIRSTDGASAYLLFELSADGTSDEALARLLRQDAIQDALRRIFVMASDWKDGADLAAYLKAHLVPVGPGYWDNPGLLFVGAPGLAVGRIRHEDELARKITEILGERRDDVPALARLARVREAIGKDAALAKALEPADAEGPWREESDLSAGLAAAGAVAVTYLWPVAALVAAWGVGVGIWHASSRRGLNAIMRAFFNGLGEGLCDAGLVAIVVVVATLIVGFIVFRRQEARDSTDERAAEHHLNAEMFERENHIAQNHMISITRRKPGLIRAFTLRVIFHVIGSLAGRLYPPGFLSGIGTIHFARWVTPPKSRDLVFLSNYDASWESYLEDFITRAHAGLTGVWSNTVGFPRTENLIRGGATDGERFKRFARRSMIPTRFWYSAYPDLTVAAIRRNAKIRRGLSGTMTEDEAKEWLALFGSANRPASRLMSSEIQSLIFGGMNFMPFGTCLIFPELSGTREAAKEGLRALMPWVAFNDGRLIDRRAVVTLALGPGALHRLGLSHDALRSFPFAFLQGMTGGSRSRILGDVGENSPEYWRWGRRAPELAILVYGVSQEAVDDLVQQVRAEAAKARMAAPHAIALTKLSSDKEEPFGFMDGASQPVIRGTYKGLRRVNPIHLVEPGEFVLGYPDNRGNLPPGPVLNPLDDPDNMLPLVGGQSGFDENRVEAWRDLGFNGSFLVIRELEQDVAAFEKYCLEEAAKLKGRLPAPYVVDADFIGAKLIGRWKDGSSLVRHPYESERTGYERRRKRGMYGEQASLEARGSARESTADPTRAGDKVRQTTEPPRYFADNDFLFGKEDPEGVRCPFGAHIRRANPRDSQDPGSAEQIAISNRHRIIRVGRRYEPVDGGNPGLLFMCLNGDIERQFEFIQQTWLDSPTFHGLSGEKDPVVGDGKAGVCGFTVPSRNGPVSLSPLPRFVTTRGGGYFFLPGKRLLEYLARAS